MNVWYTVVNVIAVFFLSNYIFLFYTLLGDNTRHFEENRLKYAVDYAVEAAFTSTLEVYDLDINYTDMSSVSLDPVYCVDTFNALMCLNYGMSLSDENFALIEGSIAGAMLLGNDGYYSASVSEVDNRLDTTHGGMYELRWGMKKPYTYVRNEGANISSANPKYSLSLLSEKNYAVYPNGGSVAIIESDTYPTGVNKTEIQNVVSDIITKEMSLALENYTKFRGSAETYSFYLPQDLSSMGVNTIDKPSMLIFLRDTQFTGISKLDYSSIGGVEVDVRRVVLGFDEGGKRYYCYDGQLPDNQFVTVIDFYEDVQEAALAGYDPHFEYLNKIYD